MTQIVVGVRLNADGSGLVGQLKLSRAELDLLRTAQKGAAEAARDLSQATGSAADAQQSAASTARTSTEANNALAISNRGVSAGARDMGGVLDRAATSVGAMATESRKAAFQLTDLSTRSEAQVRAAKRQAEASDVVTRNLGLQRIGWQQVGFQVQDIAASYASGSRLSVIFAQQSGQLASAIALIAQSAEGTKGKLAGLASFLGGPWGIALGVAVAIGSTLVSTLLKAGEAADVAKIGASGLADAQGLLGQMFDLTTGKIKSQNELLLINARLMAINLRAEAQKERLDATNGLAVAARDIRTVRATPIAGAGYAGGQVGASFEGSAISGLARQAQIASRLTDASKRSDALMDILAKSEKIDFSGANTTADEFRQYIVNLASSTAKEATSALIDKSLTDGELAPGLRQPDRRKPKKDNSAEKAAREAERLANFSDRAAEAVARLSSEYDTAPRDIDRAAQATRSIDALVDDINQRLAKSKNLTAAQRAEFAKIKGDAEALKPVIQESLVRPFLDMLTSQQRQIELGKLQVAGRYADADALQLTYSLMDKMGVESEDQLASALARRGVTADQVRALYDNLEVMRQQTREMRVQQQVQQVFLSAIGDMRENVRLTLQDLRQDGPKALGDFAKRSLDVFDRLFSEVATEKLFGGLFRDLEDQITGGDKISKAGDKLADAVGGASKNIDKTSRDILDLGKAAATATGQITGASTAVPAGWIVGDDGKAFDPNDTSITVTGSKPDLLKELKSGFREGFEGVFDDLKGGLQSVFTDIFGDKGLFNKSLGETLGKVTGYGAVGGMAGGLATGMFGVRGSGTGGMLGGAIGGAAAEELLSKTLGSFAGPIGSIAGGIVGSVVGGLLKKTKTGAANITSVDGDASLSGNSSQFRQAASGAADSVQDGLAQIANTLGGAIGAFNVTIGQRHGDWRVRTGTGSLKTAKGATEFDDDQAGAIAYAIQLAVSQGAVTGLSDAVSRALRSSTDINQALTEALKVQDVENLLGGLGSEMAAAFKAFEVQAKERLRIANQYGFDVVAIEKKNAEDRAALVDQILTDRVGSLQAFLDEMKFGNLSEGSVMDQRTALLGQIATARADAEEGKDGAADKLASLTRSLVELSRDNLGTAGSEYAADRTTAIDAAEAVIKAENERIRAAQGEQVATNTKLDKANDLSAQQVDYLSSIDESLQALTRQGANSSGGTSGGAMLGDYYRVQQL
jgi:hypothetical protein